MPRQDGTGPNGAGPKTGRGLGPCKVPSTPKPTSPPRIGRGLGNRPRRGGGRFGNG
jgi:hypothetical protein